MVQRRTLVVAAMLGSIFVFRSAETWRMKGDEHDRLQEMESGNQCVRSPAAIFWTSAIAAVKCRSSGPACSSLFRQSSQTTAGSNTRWAPDPRRRCSQDKQVKPLKSRL